MDVPPCELGARGLHHGMAPHRPPRLGSIGVEIARGARLGPSPLLPALPHEGQTSDTGRAESRPAHTSDGDGSAAAAEPAGELLPVPPRPRARREYTAAAAADDLAAAAATTPTDGPLLTAPRRWSGKPYRGVVRVVSRNKRTGWVGTPFYQARITYKGQCYTLSTNQTPEPAAREYAKAALAM